MGYTDPNIDIIADLLRAVLAERPGDIFCQSLQHQYQDRGGLSKKQLEGLLGKATKFTNAPVAKLATLEAIILKKHSKQKSLAPVSLPEDEPDRESPPLVARILEKYPGHKRVLFFKMKIEQRQSLGPQEKDELKKFAKLLLK